jgi:hypothetical protein
VAEAVTKQQHNSPAGQQQLVSSKAVRQQAKGGRQKWPRALKLSNL